MAVCDRVALHADEMQIVAFTPDTLLTFARGVICGAGSGYGTNGAAAQARGKV